MQTITDILPQFRPHTDQTIELIEMIQTCVGHERLNSRSQYCKIYENCEFLLEKETLEFFEINSNELLTGEIFLNLHTFGTTPIYDLVGFWINLSRDEVCIKITHNFMRNFEPQIKKYELHYPRGIQFYMSKIKNFLESIKGDE